MSKAIIEQPGVAPITVPLMKDTVHLGRAEDNDVALVADEVSRHHAKIVRRGQHVVLYDLSSLNGTYVNRQRVVERVLSNNDEIWLGSKCRILFQADADEPHAPAEGRDSTLLDDLNKIRAEMESVGNNMTLIGMQAKTPAPAAVPAPAVSPEELVKMGRAFHRLDALYKATKLIASEFDLHNRLSSVLDTAIDVMKAQRGFIVLKEVTSDALKVSVARQMGQELQASSPSMGIAGRAAIDGEPVLMANRDRDERFGGRESIIRLQICSAMCVPLKVEDRILGSIYVDTRDPSHMFDEEDLELFASLASQSAMAVENDQLYERMIESEKKRASLGRFLSPSIVEEIMKEDTVLELGGRKRIVTTMFCDVRGFTPIAERVSPTELVDMLNEHFTAMTAIIFEQEGTLDKYIGDEIMAVFGSPLSTGDDAFRAVKAAIAIQTRNAELNERRKQQGRPVFELGIGIATGEAIAGYIGSPDRMEFTVVGDKVNTARRLCSLAEPGQVIVSDGTYNMIQERVEATPIGTVMLKGKEEPVHAYKVDSVKG
jgi:adenylate cyclase